MIMERLKYLLLGILALTLTGCGQAVIETLNVPETPGYNAPGSGKTAVILPFADYSNGDDIASAHRRNLMVTETLTDRMVAVGFALPVQEDVFQYLVTENIIGIMPYEAMKSPSLQYELSGDWSDTMKTEIQHYIRQQNMEQTNGASGNPGAHGLTPKTIAKIGRYFNADYIVRGRILEYKTREDTEWAPWKKGILPFINNGANRILFGFAESDSYDQLNHQFTGAILGAKIGYENDYPWGNGDEILGISGGSDANSILWGGVGYGAGKSLYRSGRVEQAAVQLRIWIQEAATGDVVWTNRISVKVSPESFLADNQYDVLFNQAIEKGVATLIDNFVIYSLM
jgi:hypothetical protein